MAKSNVSRWPNNLNGLKMVDGIGLLIGAKVYIKDDPNNLIDSEVVTDTTVISAGKNLHEVIIYRQVIERKWMLILLALLNMDYTGFGYFNETSEYPAMSNRPNSWPPNGWPSVGDQTKWQGEWDGRFGRGVIYADMETYFVANDAQDQEYLELGDRVNIILEKVKILVI